MTAREKVLAALETAKKATEGCWVFGRWTIYDEDRPAQQRGDPFWTLEDGEDCITLGPLGRKSKDIDYILTGAGYECDGLSVSPEDRQHIVTMNSAFSRALLESWLEMDAALAKECFCHHWPCECAPRKALESARVKLEKV